MLHDRSCCNRSPFEKYFVLVVAAMEVSKQATCATRPHGKGPHLTGPHKATP